jgi:hypothetical protein
MTTWQAIVITSALIGTATWIVWVCNNKKSWKFSVAPLGYLLHVLIFYSFAILGNIQPKFLNGWSNAVRFHGILLIIGLGLILIYFGRNRWKLPT